MEKIHIELQELVVTFLAVHPGFEGKKQLADKLYVSMPTVERWARGKNLPSTKLATTLVGAMNE